MGSAISAVGSAVGLNKATGGGLKNALFGKKVAPSEQILNPLDYMMKKKGLQGYKQGMRVLRGDLNRARKGKYVMGDIRREQKQVGAGVEDAKRRLAQLQAQRGLGGSSIGLGQSLGLEKKAIDRKGDIMASAGSRIRDARTRAAQNLLGASQFGAGRVIDKKIEKGGRKGGMAGLLGAGIGAAFGGAEGAKLGGSLGNMAQQMA